MTNKCRRRMNGREEYIITEITQSGGGRRRRRLRERREALGVARGVGDSRPRMRGPFSLRRWAARFCVFFTRKTSRRLIRAKLLDPLSTNSL